MNLEKGLPIKTLRGDRLLVRRFRYPEKISKGDIDIILPDSYIKHKEDVNVDIELPKFQNRGEVIGIGDGVEKGIYSLGDIVHFQPNYYFLAFFDKEDVATRVNTSTYVDNAEVLLDATNGVDWIEEVEIKETESKK